MIELGYSVPLAGLFQEVFGVFVGGIYQPEISQGADDPTTKASYYGVKYLDDQEQHQLSSLGTPIIYPIKFGSDLYRKYNDQGEIVDVNMGDFRLPIASVVSFRRDKIVSQTKINGGYGTVKEIYGFDDWQITINGFLIPDSTQPQGLFSPLDQEKEIQKWDDLACSIEVFGYLFDVKKIKNLTIKGINFEPMRGKPNIRAFTINAVSDEPIELNIKSGI